MLLRNNEFAHWLQGAQLPLRASPAVLSMWSCSVKMDEETPTNACSTHKNGLGSANSCRLPWLVKGSAPLCTCKKECNKYDLTAAQCFWFAHHNDWSRWFVISSPPPICCPSFSFIGGVANEYITKLGCEKYFLRVTYWAPLAML